MQSLIAIVKWLALSGCIAFTSSCTSPANKAPDHGVVYLEHDEVRFMMQKMAAMVFNLEKLIEDSPNLSSDEQQFVVIEQLGEIEKVAIKLGAGTSTTNHYVIDRGIGDLVDEIKLAKNAATEDPPQYDPAFGLVKQCRACHIRR